MPKANRAAVRKRLDQINTIILNPKLHEALNEAAKDRQLLRQAKANPRTFLRRQGVAVPTALQVKISGTIRVCVRICGRVGPVIICVEICGTITF